VLLLEVSYSTHLLQTLSPLLSLIFADMWELHSRFDLLSAVLIDTGVLSFLHLEHRFTNMVSCSKIYRHIKNFGTQERDMSDEHHQTVCVEWKSLIM
jgi:hypothetical protein